MKRNCMLVLGAFLLTISRAEAGPIPVLNVADLASTADVIVLGRIVSSSQVGVATLEVSSEKVLSRVMAAKLHVQEVLQEMAENTDVLIQLNPDNLAGAYAYDALANLNLNHLDAAQKSAEAGIRVDWYGGAPMNLHLLGVILMLKGDYVGAAAKLKKYLEVAHWARDKAIVRKQIAACEAKHAAQPRDGNR